MKTDIEIKDDIYDYLKDSSLTRTINGNLYKRLRPTNSTLEDVVISVLANSNGQMQEAFVNVNIYVKDNLVEGQYEEDTIRCRLLCRIASEVLELGRGDGYRFTLNSQRVLKVEGRNEHLINNKLLYQQNNE